MATNNEGYEFKKLSDAEVVTSFSEGDSVVLISDSDTKQIDHQQFIDVTTQAAIDATEEGIMSNILDSEVEEELPETAKVLVVDEVEDPETGETTKEVKRVPSDQFGKGGDSAQWYSVSLMVSGSDAMGTLSPVKTFFDNISIGSGDGSSTEFTTEMGELTDDVEVKVDGVTQTLGTDYTYEVIFPETYFMPRSVITFTNAPANGASITVNGTMVVMYPNAFVYEGSDYNCPAKHVNDPVNPAVLVDSATFIDAAVNCNVKIKGVWDPYFLSQYAPELADELSDFNLGCFTGDGETTAFDLNGEDPIDLNSFYVYSYGDLVPSTEYECDTEQRVLTFNEAPAEGDVINVFTTKVFDWHTSVKPKVSALIDRKLVATLDTDSDIGQVAQIGDWDTLFMSKLPEEVMPIISYESLVDFDNVAYAMIIGGLYDTPVN